jgi:hypothetical protein
MSSMFNPQQQHSAKMRPLTLSVWQDSPLNIRGWLKTWFESNRASGLTGVAGFYKMDFEEFPGRNQCAWNNANNQCGICRASHRRGS